MPVSPSNRTFTNYIVNFFSESVGTYFSREYKNIHSALVAPSGKLQLTAGSARIHRAQTLIRSMYEAWRYSKAVHSETDSPRFHRKLKNAGDERFLFIFFVSVHFLQLMSCRAAEGIFRRWRMN